MDYVKDTRRINNLRFMSIKVFLIDSLNQRTQNFNVGILFAKFSLHSAPFSPM